jgi:class 3 adenylate cyclase
MSTIRDWLFSLGLSEYSDRFEAQRIVFEILPDLTDQDLEKLGVLLGDRRKILRAARELDTARKSPGTHDSEGPRLGDAAERRQLSVLFVDLVGSTELSARLDPEDFAQVIGAYQRICASAIAEFEGSVAKYLGDGVLAYFGYPEAHEDDAERAIRAGLRLIDAMSAVDTGSGIRPQVRIGVATGLVVVGELIGEGSSQERLAVGETLNLAARIQAAASPDCLVVAESTRRLAGAAFAYGDLGRQDLKGVAGGTRLWRVLGESEVQGRFDVRVVKGLTPFVGRGEEIGLLRRHWESAKESEGQVVLLSAPAGVGSHFDLRIWNFAVRKPFNLGISTGRNSHGWTAFSRCMSVDPGLFA